LWFFLGFRLPRRTTGRLALALAIVGLRFWRPLLNTRLGLPGRLLLFGGRFSARLRSARFLFGLFARLGRLMLLWAGWLLLTRLANGRFLR
jgi:hypothetical protein